MEIEKKVNLIIINIEAMSNGCGGGVWWRRGCTILRETAGRKREQDRSAGHSERGTAFRRWRGVVLYTCFLLGSVYTVPFRVTWIYRKGLGDLIRYGPGVLIAGGEMYFGLKKENSWKRVAGSDGTVPVTGDLRPGNP
jgi:hypothetical protein